MSAHVLLAAFVAILLPAPLHGWGDVGHSITGHIAMSYFYGNTAALMASIVPDVAGNISDPSVASWPDTIRCANCSYPYTNPYHTVNLPTFQCFYDPVANAGPAGDANAAIQNYTRQLGAPSSSPIPRNESLKYVVHFIGDIHQPLHAGNARDGNGNSIRGLWFGGVVYPTDVGVTNLHSVWDTGIIDQRIDRDFHSDPMAYKAYLLDRLQRDFAHLVPLWRDCGAQSPQAQVDNYQACSLHWIQESAAHACYDAYVLPNGTVIDPLGFMNLSDAYYHANLRVVELRLMQAGVRMAHVLNLIANGWTPSSGGGGDGQTEGYSGGVVALLVVALVLALVALCAVVGLYRRKERLGLSGLFDRSDESSSGSTRSDQAGLRTSLL